MEWTIQELRDAWRQIARAPRFSVAVVACLSLGVGANTAVFSLLTSATLADVAVRSSLTVALGTSADSQTVEGALVSANFFQVLGIAPHAGRWLRPEDDVRRSRSRCAYHPPALAAKFRRKSGHRR